MIIDILCSIQSSAYLWELFVMSCQSVCIVILSKSNITCKKKEVQNNSRMKHDVQMTIQQPFDPSACSKISLCTTSLVPEDLTPDSYQSRQVKSSAILVRVWLALSCGGWYPTFWEGHIIQSSCAAISLSAANISAIIRHFGDLRVCPMADNCYDTFGVWTSKPHVVNIQLTSTCSVEASHHEEETHPAFIPTLLGFSPASQLTKRWWNIWRAALQTLCGHLRHSLFLLPSWQHHQETFGIWSTLHLNLECGSSDCGGTLRPLCAIVAVPEVLIIILKHPQWNLPDILNIGSVERNASSA